MSQFDSGEPVNLLISKKHDVNDPTPDIRPATLVQLHKIGFKLVPLSSDHNILMLWTNIYENPNFWSPESIVRESKKFNNVATVFGKTHIKDRQGGDLYLNDLDGDSEPVYNVMTTPIENISDTALRSKLQSLFSNFNLLTEKNSLLDCLREITVVVKTRKPHGFHVFWLSHHQYEHIGTKDCKSGHQFEIKTDKSLGHTTLPPSTHRDDKSFMYFHIGRKDRIEIIDDLYGVLLWLLKGCLKPDSSSPKDDHSNSDNNDNPKDSKEEQRKHKTTTLYDLSDEIIQTTVAYFTPYYQVGHRNNFALTFSGAAWYAKISEDSAGKILSQLAATTNDDEIYGRQLTLHSTYEKVKIGGSVTGGPTLVDLISQITGCDADTSRRKLATIQTLWREDILWQRRQKQKEVRNSESVISVSEAIREIEGPASVIGRVVGMNAVQPMILRIYLECSQCSESRLYDYTSRPVWRSPIRDGAKSHICACDENTITIKYEYVASLEIQIQDIEKINNIEQLSAILFKQETEGVQFNNIVTLKGNIHVVRKYDSPSNRLQSVLFVESVKKQSTDEEVRITEEDLQEFKLFAQPVQNDENNKEILIIDKLVSMTAPLTIGNDLAKKALLIVAVNAGLPNDPNRLPKRIRSHAGLIGDPGLAKSTLIHQVSELVPGSRVESMQSGTPVSMTVYIDKEENGQRTVRPGPVVLASGAILGLNEFGQMKNIEDNKYFTDSAEEGSFTVTKQGCNIHVEAHPSFIWTANPLSGRWKNPGIITEVEFPILAQWGDRMDFIIPFIERTDEASIREYSRWRLELEKRLGDIPSITSWLKRYLYYARPLNPSIAPRIRTILENYLVDIAKQGVRGIARKLEALERTAIGFAKLKLKDAVDEDDAYDTMHLFNEMLKFYKQEVNLPKNPRDMVFLNCLNVLEKAKPQIRSIDQLIEKACSENKSDDLYIGKVKKSQYNSKIKALKPLFEKHPNVQICSRNPTAYCWVDKNDHVSPNQKNTETKVGNNRSEESPDVTDVTDGQKKKDEIKNSCTDNKPTATTERTSTNTPTISLDVNANSQSSTSDASDASDDSSRIMSQGIDLKKSRLELKYSKAAQVLTNDTFEDIDDGNIEDGSTSNIRGESL